MAELLQQTLYIDIKDLTPCVEEDEEGNENFIQTNFDIMISDYVNNIIDEGHIVLGKTIVITNEKIYCIVQYTERPEEKKVSAVKSLLQDM